jgi:glycosyltransferase involved in cell wall biosynthesis
MKTIIAMPAYNEANYIGSVVLQAKQYGDEVIVADDGSKDQTADIAELAGATVIRHATNQGKGAGVRDIIAEAAKRNADVLVLMDADAQHDPREIPGLIKAVAEGADLAIGSRSIGRENIPSYRKVGQKVLSKLTGTLSKAKVMDTESGFRAFSRKAINTLHLKENGFAIESEMISEAADQGLNIVEVPITAIYTQDGSTLNPITHGLGNVNRIMVLISERKPVLYFGVLGGLLILLGVIAGVMVYVIQSTAGVLPTGTALLSMLLITVGTLLVSTGIILEVLVKRIGNKH